jgi:hypothetical protein
MQERRQARSADARKPDAAQAAYAFAVRHSGTALPVNAP